MPAPAGQVPIVATLAAGWTFFRANAAALAPFAIGLALLSMLVWTSAPMPGGSPPPVAVQALFPVWALMAPFLVAVMRASGLGAIDPLLAFVLVGAAAMASVGYWAFLLRRAMGDQIQKPAPFGEDWARLARVFAALWFLILILVMAAFIVLSFVLSAAMTTAGVTNAEILAAQNDEAAVMAIVSRTMASSAGLIVWAALAAIAVGFAWMFARLCLSGPATIARGKAMAFDAWSFTKGDGLRIALIYGLMAAPVIALALTPVLLVDAAQSDNAAAQQGAVTTLFVLQGFSMLLQTWVIMPMMAGAGAFLYRGLRPA